MCGGMKGLSICGRDCGLFDVWNVCGELWFESSAKERWINVASPREY